VEITQDSITRVYSDCRCLTASPVHEDLHISGLLQPQRIGHTRRCTDVITVNYL